MQRAHPLSSRAVDPLEEGQHPCLLAGAGGAVEEQVRDLSVLRLLRDGRRCCSFIDVLSFSFLFGVVVRVGGGYNARRPRGG